MRYRARELGACVAALALALQAASQAATSERPDGQMRVLLRAAIAEAVCFTDRFAAALAQPLSQVHGGCLPVLRWCGSPLASRPVPAVPALR